MQRGAPSTTAPSTQAPYFDLPDLDGRHIRLEQYRGTCVLLNFWAFWCDTWRAEMPHLRELSGRREDLNFQIVAISVDGTRLPEFAPGREESVAFPVLLDVGGTVTERYGVDHVPTVILVDAKGRVRYKSIAWPGNQVILNQLRKLASAPAQPALPVAHPAATTGRRTGHRTGKRGPSRRLRHHDK